MLPPFLSPFRLNPIKHVRVIASLAQLHQEIVELACIRLVLVSEDVLRLQQLLIDVELHGLHVYINDNFYLVRELISQVGLRAPQEEGPQNLVQRLDQLEVLLVARRVGCGCIFLIFFRLLCLIIKVEPLIEVIFRGKNLRHHHIEKTPKLSEVVLQGCPCKQKAVLSGERARCHRDLRVLVFEFMCLIHYHVLPLELFESRIAYEYALVCSKADVEAALNQLLLDYLLSHFELGVQLHHAEEGCPFRELALPIGDS